MPPAEARECEFRFATYMRKWELRSRTLVIGQPKTSMTMKTLMSVLVIGSSFALASCNPLENQPVGNSNVPQPAKPVELNRYLGKWYEQARYEASFQKGCETVTAEYSQKPDGAVAVVNSCHQGGTLKTAQATARVVEGSTGSKLKVTFFWPIEGNYWVLDRAPDYSWSIVGEPSGRYLWILTRNQALGPHQYAALVGRAKALGYDVDRLKRTQQ